MLLITQFYGNPQVVRKGEGMVEGVTVGPHYSGIKLTGCPHKFYHIASGTKCHWLCTHCVPMFVYKLEPNTQILVGCCWFHSIFIDQFVFRLTFSGKSSVSGQSK